MNWYIEVLKKYTVFDGRASRSEYWYFVLFNAIISVTCTILDLIIGSEIGIIGIVYNLAVLVPYVAVTIRRLHDVGKSGWWQLIVLIPIIGIVLLIIWTVTDSMPGENQYGKNPKENIESQI